MLKSKYIKLITLFFALNLITEPAMALTDSNDIKNVDRYINSIDTKFFNKLAPIGSKDHMSPDLKNDFRSINQIYDNYGLNKSMKFGNFISSLILYGNDLYDTNRIQHTAEGYTVLANKYKSKNFKHLYVIPSKSDKRGTFKVYALSGTEVCKISFYFMYSRVADETEDFYTKLSKIDHNFFSKPICSKNIKLSEGLNDK